MPRGRAMGKLYRIFTIFRPIMGRRSVCAGVMRGYRMVVGIAALMFVALFGWGEDYFHWTDPTGRIQLALFASFILGIICGYKTKQ
jgi:hypothetical protein